MQRGPIMRIATWNTEWRETRSPDAAVIRERLHALSPDIVCLTETHFDFLAEWGGYSICGSEDWGGPTYGTRREVLLWSRTPWHGIDKVGSGALPPGRFIRGVTQSPIGKVDVVGIVIPYHMSNVRHGTGDRKMWELHRDYLEALPAVTEGLPATSLVVGDFNQRVPSSWVPRELRKKLATAMADLTIVTDGILEPVGKAAIDHIAVGSGLAATDILSISNENGRRRISDHFGVAASLELREGRVDRDQ